MPLGSAIVTEEQLPAPDAPAPPATSTDVVPEPTADTRPEPPPVPWTLRRVARTAGAESWDVIAGADLAGTLSLVYADGGGVEGLLALVADQPDEDAVRGLLGWVTDMLALDESAGAGATIHWRVSTGPLTEFWCRSPGRRAGGAERDMSAVRARVEGVLSGHFGGFATLEDGDYSVDVGSVRVFVAPRHVDETTIGVRVFSITNVDLPADADPAGYLLGLNFGFVVGRFSLDGTGTAVWFDHVLVGHEVDDVSLVRVVGAVAGTADQYDDEIKKRYGGRTFREEGSPVEHAAQLAGADMAGGYL